MDLPEVTKKKAIAATPRLPCNGNEGRSRRALAMAQVNCNR